MAQGRENRERSLDFALSRLSSLLQEATLERPYSSLTQFVLNGLCNCWQPELGWFSHAYRVQPEPHNVSVPHSDFTGVTAGQRLPQAAPHPIKKSRSSKNRGIRI